MYSIDQAAERRITRLKLSKWANMDHIEINIFDKKPGPWVSIWSPINAVCGFKDPIKRLITEFDLSREEWVEYTGPLPGSLLYKEAVRTYGSR